MSIYFQGSYPACIAAGVLLYTKARRFGISLYINIVDEDLEREDVSPCMFYSPLLVALGVPHSKEDSSTIILSGKSEEVGLIRYEENWYSVDRSGSGFRDETKQLLNILSSHDSIDIQLRQSFMGLCQLCTINPEPGIFDLFFSMSQLPDKLNSLLLFGGDQKRRLAFQQVYRRINQMSRPDLYQSWKERSKGTSLHRALLDIEKQWNELNPTDVAVYSTSENLGLQRNFIDFLGSAEEQLHPFDYLRQRYLFLGGKFVDKIGKGLYHHFPESSAPTGSTDFIDWLLEQVQLGSNSVESIWKRYTEPEQ